jgi:hypothetical protein
MEAARMAKWNPSFAPLLGKHSKLLRPYLND